MKNITHLDAEPNLGAVKFPKDASLSICLFSKTRHERIVTYILFILSYSSLEAIDSPSLGLIMSI